MRGKSSYFPFRPGGLGDLVLGEEGDGLEGMAEGLEKAFEKGRGEWAAWCREEGADETQTGGIRTIPPGFIRGLDFGPLGDGAEGALMDEEEEVEVTPIYRPMLEITSDGRTTAVLVGWDWVPARRDDADAKLLQHARPPPTVAAPQLDSTIEDLLPSRVRPFSLSGEAGTDPSLQRLLKAPTSTSTRRRPVVAKRDWAHVVDVNREIVNFRELVPDMAKEVRSPLSLCKKAEFTDLSMRSTLSSWTRSRRKRSTTSKSANRSLSLLTRVLERRSWPSTLSHWQLDT